MTSIIVPIMPIHLTGKEPIWFLVAATAVYGFALIVFLWSLWKYRDIWRNKK